MNIVDQPATATNRLAQLGWSMDELIEVVFAMVAARRGCTENDPSSAGGWMSWRAGVRRMNEIGVLKSLRKVEVDNVPWTVDETRKLRFTVANCDSAVGRVDVIPQNRNKRGAAAERTVDNNAHQYVLFADIAQGAVSEAADRLRAVSAVAWYLMVYCDGDDIRAEISCPVGIDGGYFSSFVERIFLSIPDGPIGPDFTESNVDPSVEFDVPVVRTKSQ